MLRLGLVFWLVLFAFFAFASPKEDALVKRKTGDKMMTEGAFEEALKAYDEAKATFPDPEIDLFRGDALLKLRRYEESKTAYQTYLDSAKSNKSKNEVKKAISDIDRILKTFLECQSEPAGATVYLNSRVDGEVGPTPLNFNLPPGTHRIIFVKQGFKPKTETITILEGEKATISTKLEVAPFIVEVSTTPNNADIFVDGQAKGKSPSTIEVSEGAHELELRLENFQTLSKKIEGKAGDKFPLAHTFIENPSQLLLTTEPAAEGNIAITGKDLVGKIGQPLELPPGRYNLIVTAKGYKEASVEVSIEKAKTTESKVSLEPFPVKLVVKSNVSSFTTIVDNSPQALVGNAVDLAPGKHTVRVEAPNYTPYQIELVLQPGEPMALETELRLKHRPLTYALAGAGVALEVAGLIVGTTALFALHKHNKLVGICNPAQSCNEEPQHQDLIDSATHAKDRADAADGLYQVGLIPALILVPIGGYRYLKKEGPSKGTTTKLPQGNP
jgi:hypothetical protein